MMGWFDLVYTYSHELLHTEVGFAYLVEKVADAVLDIATSGRISERKLSMYLSLSLESLTPG